MRRIGVDLSLLVAAGALAWLAFGWPDPAGALDLVRSGSGSSHPLMIAGVGLLAWLVISAICVVLLVSILRRTGRWARAVAVLALGATLLSVGIAVHLHRGVDVCCGSMESAQQALGEAP